MEFNKIFVVYDPTRSEQPALDRALAIVGAADVKVHIYACIHAELEEGNKPLEVPKLIAALGVEAIAFGSHMPFDYMGPSLVKLANLEMLAQVDYEKIAWRNAANFFKLEMKKP